MGDINALAASTLAGALPTFRFDGVRLDLFEQSFRVWTAVHNCAEIFREGNERPEARREAGTMHHTPRTMAHPVQQDERQDWKT